MNYPNERRKINEKIIGARVNKRHLNVLIRCFYKKTFRTAKKVGFYNPHSQIL